MMGLTFKDILDRYEFEDIENVFFDLYGDHFKTNAVGYEEVFECLKEMDTIVTTPYLLDIDHVKEEEYFEDYEHVSAISLEDGLNYAIGFMPWNEWLGMRLNPQVLEKYSEEEIISHCLWEMTFYGYDEDTRNNVLSDIEGSVKDLKREFEIEEIEDLTDKAESKDILKKMLKAQIDSSSSSD